jgi:DNA adenine methylase
MKPLFMWAGGKSKMMKHYVPFMNFGKIETYSEPFFGGGAMFLHMMQAHEPKKAWINDINGDIMGIYRAIRDQPVRFMQQMDVYQAVYLPLAKEDRKKYFYELRDIHAFDYDSHEPTDRAALLYFLMKTAFNGIWQINKNTNGKFGTPSGLLNQRDSVYDRENVDAWSRILNSSQVEIMSGNWSSVPTSQFTFMDPPYRDSFADYNESFPDAELQKLMKMVEDNKGVWLCNRDCGDGFFDKMNATVHRFPVTYTAGRRKKTEDGYEAKKAIEILAYN